MGRFATPRPFLAHHRRAAARRSASPVSPPPVVRLARPGVLATAALSLAVAAPAAAQAPIPQGPEFRVNTHTTGMQRDAAVAMDADGDFLVVWTSVSGFGVYAQRYDAEGGAQGPEFRVSSAAAGGGNPAAAMADDGDFVVVWTSGDGHDSGVHARRYDAAGAPQGEEFQVNVATTGYQGEPSAAMDADGDFVVSWYSVDYTQLEGLRISINARRYSTEGGPLSGEITASAWILNGSDGGTAVAMDDDGDFVVVWEAYGLDGDNAGVFARLYDADGGARGEEFRVNTYTTRRQAAPSVAMDADGDFAVVWESDPLGAGGQDGDNAGVFGQRYDAAGVPLGGEFQVNTTTTSSQRTPGVGMDGDGDFVVTWASYGQDGDQTGVFGQVYTAAGAAVGGEFQVNAYTTGYQVAPSLAMEAGGDFVVVWEDSEQDGDDGGIYAQRFSAGLVAAEPGPEGGLTLAVAPNPLDADGRVRYAVAEAGPVRLSLHDVLGREAAVLAEGTVAAGAHEALIDGSALAPGAYVLRLEADGQAFTRVLTVAR